jgi:hypothetical protein
MISKADFEDAMIDIEEALKDANESFLDESPDDARLFVIRVERLARNLSERL